MTALEAYKLPVKGCWLVSTLQSLAGEKAFETRTQPDGFIPRAGRADGAEAREPEGLGSRDQWSEDRAPASASHPVRLASAPNRTHRLGH